METVTIYGASDDLIETHGIHGCDEFSRGGKLVYAGFITINAPDGGNLEIHCLYSGYWCFGVGSAMAPDYDKLPEWPIRRTFGTRKRYSETLEIDVPDGAYLTFSENEPL